MRRSRQFGQMKNIPLIVAASTILFTSPIHAQDRTIALGDSLSFAYEASFGFRFTILIFGTFGDGFGPEVKNWMEILRDPAYRGADYDFGPRNTFNVLLGPTLLFRHDSNWSLPGLRIWEMREFLEGTLTFQDLLDSDPNLAQIEQFSSLDADTAFELTDFQDQVRDDAKRLVLFIGGNDVRGVYGTIYQGGDATPFIDSFLDDAEAILDIIETLNPDLPVVVVSVPHIGITPDIKSNYPTDPIPTGRVTTALRTLNNGLRALADARGHGYADVFTPTLPLLQSDPFSIQGIAFDNVGSTTGSLNAIWLNGELSANFHPNTHGQAIIANEIVRAFNRTHGDQIAPLTATEILGGLLGKSAAEIDMTFDSWAASYGLPGISPDADADGDGIPAGVEFALGLNPILRDADLVSHSIVHANGSSFFELAFPERLPGSPRYTLQPITASSPAGPYTPVAPALGTDGNYRAQIPITQSPAFMRLESLITD